MMLRREVQGTQMWSIAPGPMTVSVVSFTILLDKIIAFCESGSNKLYFSKSGTEDGSGEFIKSYTICEVVRIYQSDVRNSPRL